jgi:pSer/pThr/pTyr-binding forkhead associated (FHA) protein
MPLIDDLASYTSDFMDTCDGGELQHRLRLYQVFLKLYEHHRGLLDEILNLEHSGSKTLSQVPLPYLQGVIAEQEVFLTTNLLQGKTQSLLQPQNTWVIGRDPRRVSIPIQDARLSRCHAALKYVENAGFYLIDLGSRNGSYVNGEPIRRSRLLCDGDRIRLGSLTLVFFVDQMVKSLPVLSADLEELLENWQPRLQSHSLNPVSDCDEVPTEGLTGNVNPLEDTSMFMRSNPLC